MEPGSEPPPVPSARERGLHRVRRAVLGGPKNLQDPHLFHSISLAAFLAWVGLGADGLSSSSYGPEEAFKNLGQHTYLAVFLAVLTAVTVLIIAASYSKIIEHFPFGGGGYVVATRLIGARAGVLSGSALLVDYVLTITTSIASGGDAVFSNLPHAVHWMKLPVEFVVICLLTILNLRGVKESVRTLVPVFLVFLLTHVILIVGSVFFHLGRADEVARTVSTGLSTDLRTIGFFATAALFLRAYSLGAGTYTGIEAVSNGLQIMREPRVATAKRTMVYMAVSLALTAAGIILGYLLMDVQPVPGKTMNAVLAGKVAGGWDLPGLPLGHGFVVLTLAAEALLLFVAAQAGFIDGPRVMANMAHDSWLPHRFGALSDRLTMQNGVLLMGGTSLFMLWYTGGSVDALVVMYSINVFVTFSLSQAGMIRYWWMKETRKKYPDWARHLPIHLIGFVLCFAILVVNVAEKFLEGAWLTVIVTGAVVTLCFLIKRHYVGVRARLLRLDQILTALPHVSSSKPLDLQKKKPTAVLLVGSYSGLGIHALLTIVKLFPRYFVNVVFMSVGVIDSATFQGVEEVDRVREETEQALRKYVEVARGMGIPADYRFSIGTEAVSESEKLAGEIAKEYERSIFFAGKLIFQREHWWDRVLHNETANLIQRRLQFAGLPMVILPVRVLE
jgi:amino acid transporter